MDEHTTRHHLITRYPWLGPFATAVMMLFIVVVLLGLVQMAMAPAAAQGDATMLIGRVLQPLMGLLLVSGLSLSALTAVLVLRARAHAVDWPGTFVIAALVPILGAAFLLVSAAGRARADARRPSSSPFDAPVKGTVLLVSRHPLVRAGGMTTFAALFALAMVALLSPDAFTREPEPVWMDILVLVMFTCGIATMIGATARVLQDRARVVDAGVVIALTWMVPILGVATMIGLPGWRKLVGRPL